MKLNKLLILFSFLLCSVSNFGQTSLIGKITTIKGEPVVDATVYLDTIKTKTTINVIGYFEVKVPEGTKEITIHSPKYGYLTTEYNNEKRLSFMFMEPGGENTTTPIVEENSTSSSSINTLNVSQDKNTSTYATIYDYLDGKVAGVSVLNDEITIRGGSSWELSNEPLFVVNGIVVGSIENISPIDIDNINVLKGVDASLYGSRGSNGVIEITTK